MSGAPELLVLLALLAQASPVPQAPRAPDGEARHLMLPGPVSGLATLDLDGDGRRDLVAASDDSLEVRGFEQGAAPFFKAVRGTARSLAWCTVVRPRGRDELWLVNDEGAVKRVEVGDAAAPAAPTPVTIVARDALAAGRLVLPSGIFAFPFARDLNGDGRTDLALPVPSGLKLWFGKADGSFEVGASVKHRLEVDLGFPAPGQSHPAASVDVTIPSFDVVDQNGDGHPDLAFESADRMQFFWSDAQGHLPETPTFEIDLDEIKQRLGGDEEDLIDPSNLFKVLKNQVNATVRDLDGDGCADLLLRQGPKVGLYAGTKAGIDRTKAVQVLKTSGNLIAVFVADDSGDGKLDLCMVQAADISLGEVLLWVVAGGKVELDLFTYFQDDQLHFARSPSRKRKLILDLPNLLTIASELDKNPQLKELGDELSRQPVTLDLDGDGGATDLALMARNGQVELFVNVLEAAPAVAPAAGTRSVAAALASDDVQSWHDVIDRYDREAKGADGVTIPLLEVLDWVPMPGGKMRTKIAGRKPTTLLGEVDPATRVKNRDDTTAPTRRFLVVEDLDGDRRDDLIVVDPSDGTGAVRMTFFVTPSR